MMIDSFGTRAAPLVIIVPPPERSPFETGVAAFLFIVAGVFICAGAGLVLMLSKHVISGFVLASILWGAAVLIVRWLVVTKRRHSTARAETLRALPPGAPHPLVEQLAMRWRDPIYTPSAADFVRIVVDYKPQPQRGMIICLGVPPGRDDSDLRFEPEIVPTTQFLARRLKGAIPVWIMVMLSIVPNRTAAFGGSLPIWLYPLAMLAAVSLLWTWRGIIRPTYIRLAPGIVQVMEYSVAKRIPRIRSYPITSGTVIIVSNTSGMLKVHLARGEMQDTIPLYELRKPKEQLERIWPALLSTAPTPPLSDEELLG